MENYQERIAELEKEVRHWQEVNEFVKKNTINSIASKIEWLRREMDEAGRPTYGIVQCLEIVHSMRG